MTTIVLASEAPVALMHLYLAFSGEVISIYFSITEIGVLFDAPLKEGMRMRQLILRWHEAPGIYEFSKERAAVPTACDFLLIPIGQALTWLQLVIWVICRRPLPIVTMLG